MQIKPTRIGFLSKYRTLILISALILFLPPLAVIFQVVTGDNNFCGKWCPRMFFIWRQGITSQQYFMGMMRSYMGVALVLGILGTTFFLGRYWCGHFCPIGGATELGLYYCPSGGSREPVLQLLQFRDYPADSRCCVQPGRPGILFSRIRNYQPDDGWRPRFFCERRESLLQFFLPDWRYGCGCRQNRSKLWQEGKN
jgi:hypothetical protein